MGAWLVGMPIVGVMLLDAWTSRPIGATASFRSRQQVSRTVEPHFPEQRRASGARDRPIPLLRRSEVANTGDREARRPVLRVVDADDFDLDGSSGKDRVDDVPRVVADERLGNGGGGTDLALINASLAARDDCA